MPTAKGKRPASASRSTAGAKKPARKKNQQLISSGMVGVLVFGIGLLLLLTLFSTSNAAVLVFIRTEINGWFGMIRYVALLMLCVVGLQIAFGSRWPLRKTALPLFGLIAVCVATLLQVFRFDDINGMLTSAHHTLSYNNFLWKSYDASRTVPYGGGFVGGLLGYPFGKYLDMLGSALLLFFIIGALGMVFVKMMIPGVGESISGWFGGIVDDFGEWNRERKAAQTARRADEAKTAQAAQAERDKSLLVPVPTELFEKPEEADEPKKTARGRPVARSNATRPTSAPGAAPRQPDRYQRDPETIPIPAKSAPAQPPRRHSEPEPPSPPPQQRPKSRLYIEDPIPQSPAADRSVSSDTPQDFLALRRAQYDEAYGAFERPDRSVVADADSSVANDSDDSAENIAARANDPTEDADRKLPALQREQTVDSPPEEVGDFDGAEENPPPQARRRRYRQQNPLDYQPRLDPETRLDRPDWKPEEPDPVPTLEITETEEYRQPPFSLLISDPSKDTVDTRVQDAESAQKLEETLWSFSVDARVIKVVHGPAVTRYELQPAPGVKVSKIVNLTDDIALNMAAMGVRIEAPIPGKAAIGIEIANDDISTVYLRDVLESDESTKHPSKLAVALGKDIAGKRIIADLARMPHLLIAGATGSGKSVCINTLITSIIYRATPEEVRLILIDPKKVELSMYNGIPHLLVPVVTDPKKASGALSWAVLEMDERYRVFAEAGVRDIRGYNAQRDTDTPLMPQIVVVIDELSDLMLVAPGEVEDYICRIAQLARACGIHLVIATQRPSVNVITGIIKANIPSRIAFAVSSQVDSRTILDTAGADKLLGKGDMLYAPSGGGKPLRVQGCFVSDREVQLVTEYVKDRHTTDYSQAVIDALNNANAEEPADDAVVDDADDDPLFEQAVEMAIESGQASISMLQRRLRIGYARAGRLIDDMAKRGIITQADGAKPREVLMTREAMQALYKK